MNKTSLAGIGVVVLAIGLLAGCGPKREGGVTVLPPPSPPPAVPPVQAVPLDPSLRESAKAEIRAAAKSNDERVRAHAIEAMQEVMPDEAPAAITAALGDTSARVRAAACLAAGKLKLVQQHDKLWELAENDPHLKVRIDARYGLHRVGDMRLTRFLEQTARDLNPRAREETAVVMGLLEERSALPILKKMERDEDAGVRIQAAGARWRMGDEQAVDTLAAGLVSQFVDDQMLCLQQITGPRNRVVEGFVRGKLTGNYPQVNILAAKAMGELGYDAGYGVAMNGIRSADPRERQLAALAFGAIGRSDAQALLAPLLRDTDSEVRLCAATAILQLKEPSAQMAG
jgi:HEAT repeat protein